MLFNSYEFIFAFLPLTLLGYFAIARHAGRESAIIGLSLASLFFYAYWNPAYLLLILVSIGFNFAVGRTLARWYSYGRNQKTSKTLLTVGVTANLASIAYFKYANFWVDTLNQVTGIELYLDTIILPLGISFFTFQQITYLVDAWRGQTRNYRFSHYVLFVTFFPQLIAGPIVHHGDMIPQFMRKRALTPSVKNIAIGLAVFFIGLFKKVVLADHVAEYATPVFERAALGEMLTFFVAWGGALAYTLQLYFDFSGYSDMAVGVALLFGIRLPFNFNSPYKATSIIEFWRRWHMTLSAFLKDYVYIPLGGSHKGPLRRYLNLMLTMLLGGLWHGAGWTFVLWGGLHGLYLMINHGWRALRTASAEAVTDVAALPRVLAWSCTFVAVVVSWVLFRSADLQSAWIMLKGMAGWQGVAIPNGIAIHLGELKTGLQNWGVTFYHSGGSELVLTYLWVLTLLIIAIAMPNTQELIAAHSRTQSYQAYSRRDIVVHYPRLTSYLVWSYNARWAFITGVISTVALLSINRVSEFLYFQF